MQSTALSLVLALTGLLASSFHASAQSAWIQGFGQFGTGTDSSGVAISADGSVVAGWAFTSGTTFSSQRPVLWTSPGPAALAPDVPAGWTGFSRFNDLSGDGTVGTGVRLGGSFRWTTTGGFEDIPLRTATGISADGTTIVGESFDLKAALWTVGGGANVFGSTNSYANAANSNATIAVGQSGNVAALWKLSGSPTETLLGTLPGDTSSEAMSVSADGRIVVGRSFTETGVYQAFRWTLETGMVDLGSLSVSDTFASAQYISGNGQYILGVFPGFIWTELAGLTSVESYLAAGEVDLTGWSNLYATGITDDGRYLTGHGTFEGLEQGFVAEVVPEPSTYALLALSAAGFGGYVLRRRRK